MNDQYQSMAANAICHAAAMTMEAVQQAFADYGTPSALWKPRLFRDGNQWCALYGESLQDGVAGFGDSPYEAMTAFDRAWCEKIPKETP